jgi:hypothetical protein
VNLLRTIPWFTRLLVGLFLAAQFSGMASPPRASALPATAAAPHGYVSADHHHRVSAQDHGSRGLPCGHHDQSGSPADTCCALHACFAGLLPPVVTIAAGTASSEQLSASPNDHAPGTPGNRLDRPPRPLP